ncbi:uncharacterized protein LOC102455821 [Pelodiscus sinensis]|uniref:uncharacterized protein LOC102455821 n=1 Tax=Pelodiscus sinensis TaxID=13735 RepID=UPI003F6C2F46
MVLALIESPLGSWSVTILWVQDPASEPSLLVSHALPFSLTELPQAPSVFPLFPCCGDIAASPSCEVTIACLVTGYFPEPVAVKWNSGTGTNGTKTYPAVVRGSGNAFTLVSQLTVCPCDLERHTYQCSVEHAQSNTKIDVVVPNVCEVLVPPEVRLLPPSCERDTMEQHLELVCLLLRFTPGTAKVEWLVNGEKRLPTTDLSFGKGTDKSYTGQSRLNVTKESWKTGDVYTCKVTHPSTGKEYFMQNTSKCLACSSNSAPPSVHVTQPTYGDLLGETAWVMCVVVGSHLAEAQVSWDVDGKASPEAQKGTLNQANGSHSITSTHSITLEQWKSRTTFVCKARLPCFEEVTQEMPLMDTTYPDHEPTVSAAVSCPDPEETPGKIDSYMLLCDVTGFFPPDISVRWEYNGSMVPASQYSNSPVVGTGQAYSTQSILRASGLERGGKAGPQYFCLVQHVSLNGTLKVKVKPENCGGDCTPQAVEVFLLPPSLEDLYIAHTASITCLVSGMETHDTPEFSWTWKSGEPLNDVSRVSELQENGTYSATSVLQVCVEEWQSGEEFTCTVKHQDIPSAIVKTIHKSKEVSLRAPSVYVFPPHAKELALQEWATITCLVSGFQPRNILVLWTRKDKPMPEDAYTNIGPIREAGVEESYFIYSKLRIQASEWQKGDTFSCMVGHEGLPKIFTQQSVDKASSKPTAVNVSVVLSDTEVACH